MARKSQKLYIWANFGPKRAKKRTEKNFIPSCLNIIILLLHAKNQKILAALWPENHKKPYFWANLGPFWPKTGQKDFSEKIDLCHIITFMIF